MEFKEFRGRGGESGKKKEKKKALGNLREGSTWVVKDIYHLSCCETQDARVFSQEVLNTY